MMHHHEGDVQGELDDDDEGPLQLLESLPEVPIDPVFLRETEQASAGSFFIGVRGGVVGLDGWGTSSSSSPEEPPISNREGDVSGVSNGVLLSLSTPLAIASLS
jgi:hypothetical protein